MQGSPPGLAGSFNARTIGFAASSGLWYRRASNLTSAVWMPDGRGPACGAARPRIQKAIAMAASGRMKIQNAHCQP
jgi:hypothetical protein